MIDIKVFAIEITKHSTPCITRKPNRNFIFAPVKFIFDLSRFMRIFATAIYHKFQLEVLQQLKNKHSLSIAGATIFPPKDFKSADQALVQQAELDHVFAEAETFPLSLFYYPETIKQLKTVKTLPQSTLEAFKYLEALFYRTTDRANVFPIPIARKRRIYLKLLHFWFHKLKDLQIDYMIYFDTPHSFNGVIIAEVAKYFKIPALILEHTALQDYSLIVKDWGIPALPNHYQQNQTRDALLCELPQDIQDTIEKKDGEDHEYLKWYKERDKKLNVSGGGLKANLLLLMRFLKKAGFSIIRSSLSSLGLYNKRMLIEDVFLNNIRSEAKYRWKIIPSLYHQIKLNQYYNNLAQKEVNLEQPYIFFGMHVQPEKSSLPLGEEYDNQLLAIETIADALEDGWFIYVKEHPAQFNLHRPTNGLFRSKHFYDRLAAHPKIKLLALDFDANILMRNARFTSTITGTVGWESMLMGQPVLHFGKAYYTACHAAFKIDSVESCKKAITEGSNMTREQVKKAVVQFIHYYLQNGHLIKAVNWETKFKYTSIDRSEQINTLTSAFAKRLLAQNAHSKMEE